jgi:hypothetical protein
VGVLYRAISGAGITHAFVVHIWNAACYKLAPTVRRPQIPVAAAESIVFTAWLYFMSGLTLEVGRYFFYVFVAFLSDVFAATLFRCFTFGFPTLEAAQTGPMYVVVALERMRRCSLLS